MMTDKPRDDWYESAICAALSYHASALAISASQALRYEAPTLSSFLDSLNGDTCLGIAVLAFVLRVLSHEAFSRARKRPAQPIIDSVLFLLVMALVSAIAIPLDETGAASFSLLVYGGFGIPVVLFTSWLSLATAKIRWLKYVLLLLIAGNLLSGVVRLALAFIGV